MPRILVVESNPKVESDRLEALSGQALGQLWARVVPIIMIHDPS